MGGTLDNIVERTNYLKLSVSLILPLIAALLGGYFNSLSMINWYPNLIKPWFTPSPILFIVVWTLLYIGMGLALYLVWIEDWSRKVKIALGFFSVQYVLNILWPYLFFTLESPLYGFIEIVILWFAILGMLISFKRVSKPAGIFALIYLIWISFAAILNLSIYLLN